MDKARDIEMEVGGGGSKCKVARLVAELCNPKSFVCFDPLPAPCSLIPDPPAPSLPLFLHKLSPHLAGHAPLPPPAATSLTWIAVFACLLN